MRATVMYGAGDVRVETVPDPAMVEPTDVILRITRSCICGSDLWPYRKMKPSRTGERMGHELMGIVEEIGPAVRTLRVGDLAVAPFGISCGACEFCLAGLRTSCVDRRWWGDDTDGGQGEAARVPLADGTLVKLPVGRDDALMPSLLTLSDVMGTGHHAAVSARVRPGVTAAVVGDGAVGLCGVIAAGRLGAERIILLGRHPDRVALGRRFGATDVVEQRGDEAVEIVKEMTGGGATSVLECVGTRESLATAISVARPGGTVGWVGAPQAEVIPKSGTAWLENITIAGGVAPVRAYMDELLPDIMDGRIEPGLVFDRTIGLEEVPDGYRAMNERRALKVMIKP